MGGEDEQHAHLEAVEEQSEAGAVEEPVVVDEQAEHDAVAPLADLETVEEQACLVTKIVKMNGLCTRICIDVLEVHLLQLQNDTPLDLFCRFFTVSGSLLLTKTNRYF